jgi:hypothetical protein
MPAGMKSISASEAAGENTPHLDMSDFKAKSPRALRQGEIAPRSPSRRNCPALSVKAKSPRALRQGEIAPRSPSIKDELEARSESNS